MFTLDLTNLVKYLLEGLAVAVAAFLIPRKTIALKEIVMIALTAALIFSILDIFTPFVGSSARQGAGFGIGYNMVTGGGDEPMEMEGGADDAPAVADDASEHSVPLGVDSAENIATF